MIISMRMLSSPIGDRTKRLIALALLLWWGGLNCLTGCLLTPSSVRAESDCPMSDEGGDCCPSHTNNKKTLSEKSAEIGMAGSPFTSSSSVTCCSLDSLIPEKSRDMRGEHVTAIATTPCRLHFIPESEPRTQLPDRWARLPDRGGTYLKNCIFLI